MRAYSTPLSLIGAALVLVGGLAYLLNEEAVSWSLGNAVLGVILVVAAGIANPDLFRQYGRWINAFWGGIMVLGIIVLVNFLADRYPRRLDVTEGKLHSLADLTMETLEGLEQDVAALAFMEGGENKELELLLAQYGTHITRFRHEFIDPDRDPGRTEDYGIKRYNTLVLESGAKQQKITELTEKEITNALLKLVRDRQEKIYLTVGHGERGLGSDPHSLGLLEERLKEIDYGVEDSLFLARQKEVPQDCAVLVIAGPKTPFFANEVEAIRHYLQEGGAVLALLDPLYESGLEELLAEWGVALGDDFVIDTSGLGSLFELDFTTPVAVAYGPHPITQKHRGVMTFYQLGRSVHLGKGGRQGLEGVELVKTSELGWAETDLSVLRSQGDHTVKLDEGRDTPGPIALAVAVADSAAGSRLVVFGDSDFATNQYFDYQGNGDLVLNALSWLAEDESLISIRPRQPGYNPIALTESQGEWIFWLSVVLYPAAIALLGIAVVSRKGRWSLAELAAAGLGIVLSFGVAALVNHLGGRYHLRLDLTQDKLFTLAEDTRRLVEPLEENGQYAKVKTFMGEMEGLRFQDLLEEYGYLSKNFEYEILDPQKNALQVKQYNIRERGTSIVEVTVQGQARSERFTEQTEKALSNALLKALRAKDLKAYFTSGHGEAELDQVDGEGFSILKGRLKEMNFAVEDGLDLKKGVPDDATLVVVLAPKQPFAPGEAEAIRRHLDQGRSALFLLDPGGETGLEELLDEYSVELGQDFVVDLSGLGQLFGADVSVPVVINYGDHPIAEKIGQGTMSFFPLARSVGIAEHRRKDPEIKALAYTHRSSWGEKDLAPISGGGGKVEFDPETDLRGPVSLAVAAKAEADTSLAREGQARLVVFGDADFASNQYFAQQANGELLIGSATWLSEDEDQLEIEDKQPAYNPINLIGNQGIVILWVSVFVLPFAVALSGLVMVLRRGHQRYIGGFLSWLAFFFLGNAVFYFVNSVIGLSEGDGLTGDGCLVLALASALLGFRLVGWRGVAYFLTPGGGAMAWAVSEAVEHMAGPHTARLTKANFWYPALVLCLLCVGVGFWIIPNDTLQLLYAAIFVVNAAILVWIRPAFAEAQG
jgi:ABC-type uncharacterized transport system involved in gliding motility auxiliary subunit